MNRLLEIKPVAIRGCPAKFSTCGFFPLQPPSATTIWCRLFLGRETHKWRNSEHVQEVFDTRPNSSTIRISTARFSVRQATANISSRPLDAHNNIFESLVSFSLAENCSKSFIPGIVFETRGGMRLPTPATPTSFPHLHQRLNLD